MSKPVGVTADSFLTLHYRLSARPQAGANAQQCDGDAELVSTFELSPATIQMGGGQLAAPLERCLLGMQEGEQHSFDLAPEQAFGHSNPQLIERIARSALPADIVLNENSLVEFSTPEGADYGGGGQFSGFLRQLSATHALFDFNHPLAGKHIRFEVKIIAIL